MTTTETDAPETVYLDACLREAFSLPGDVSDIEYIRADLAKPRVKPLVWEDRIAASEVVTYRIHIGYGLMTGHFALSVNGKQIGTYPTEEAAKAAANAHHAAHVLAQLEGET